MSKENFIPKAEHPLFKEDYDKFDTVVFDSSNITDPLHQALNFSEESAEYGGTAIDLLISVSNEEASNLIARNYGEDGISTEELAEMRKNGGYLDAYIEIDNETKNVSLEIIVTYNEEKENYDVIPLKEEEADSLFRLVNEAVMEEEGKDVHDVIENMGNEYENDEIQFEN